MVVNGDPQRPRRLHDLAGHVDVRRRGRRIAAGVVMDEDDRAGVQLQGAADDLARLDRGMVDRAPVHHLVEDDGVLLVEEEDPELFAGLARHGDPHVGQQRRPRAGDGALAHHAPGDANGRFLDEHHIDDVVAAHAFDTAQGELIGPEDP